MIRNDDVVQTNYNFCSRFSQAHVQLQGCSNTCDVWRREVTYLEVLTISTKCFLEYCMQDLFLHPCMQGCNWSSPFFIMA